MTRKRYTSPVVVLQRAIAGLEREDQRSQRDAVLSLLMDGPWVVTDATARLPQESSISEVRAELLAFFRTLAGGRQAGEIGLYHSITLAARHRDGRAECEARGDGRDLVMLQAGLLVHLVGLPSIRTCEAADCPHLFVRRYRRTFCSARCQKRAYMRARRENERLQRARRTRVRQQQA